MLEAEEGCHVSRGVGVNCCDGEMTTNHALRMAAMFLSQEDEICAEVTWESRAEGQRSREGLRDREERERKECNTRTVNAEGQGKLRIAWLESESLMTTLIEYNVGVSNSEKKLQEGELNDMAVLMELKGVKQVVERLDIGNKLL